MKNLSSFTLVVILLIILGACKSQKESSASKNQMSIRENQKYARIDSSKKKLLVDKTSIFDVRLDKFRNDLVGTWKWHKTICCSRTPQTTWAENEEDSKKLEFSKDGKLNIYVNGQLETTKPYEVGNAFDDNRITVKTGEYKTALAHIKSDTLVLDYGYMDLEISYYLKEN